MEVTSVVLGQSTHVSAKGEMEAEEKKKRTFSSQSSGVNLKNSDASSELDGDEVRSRERQMERGAYSIPPVLSL